MTSIRKLTLTSYLVLTAVTFASADTVWIGETAKNPIKADGVKIVDVQGDQLIYRTASGIKVSKPLAQMQQISVDGEPAFDAAEAAYLAGNWAAATDNYQKAIQSTTEDWIKMRSSIRLVTAAAKSNRFDAAVTAYVALVQMNPKAAANAKPAITDASAPYLAGSAQTINNALDSAKLTDAQRGSLLSLELQIYRAQKDTAHAGDVLQQLEKLGALSPEDQAGLKLDTARVALDAKNYQAAEDAIQKNRALFTQSGQQVDALYILARAQDGLNADKQDPDSLKDLAIAYMRVVTFAKDLPDQPHAAESLLRVAQIEEQLKEPKVALKLYRQIATDKDNADTPVAAEARKGMERLQGT